MNDIERNQFFKRAMKKAGEILKSQPRLKNLIAKASDKARDFKIENIKTSGFVERINLFLRLVRAYAKGDYREIEWKHLVLVVAALIYFVTPLDLIPDFIPISGFIDDFTILVWVYNKIQFEIDKFKIWENGFSSDAKSVP